MKKIFFLSLLGLIGTAARAQDHYLDEFFSRHQGESQAVNLTLDHPGGILSGLLGAQGNGDLTSKITGIHLVVFSNAGDKALNDDVALLSANLQRDHFDDLMSVRKQGNMVHFLARSEAGNIKDMVLVVQGEDEIVVASMRGDITQKDLERIGSSIHSSSRDSSGQAQ